MAALIPFGFLIGKGIHSLGKILKEKVQENKEKKRLEELQKLEEKQKEEEEKIAKQQKETDSDKKITTEGQENIENLNKKSIYDYESLLCPISQELLTDPVSSPYGHCYQREAIEAWLDKHNTCPFTGKPLEKSQLVPCYTIKNIVQESLSSQ